jgi:hypothetical protein
MMFRNKKIIARIRERNVVDKYVWDNFIKDSLSLYKSVDEPYIICDYLGEDNGNHVCRIISNDFCPFFIARGDIEIVDTTRFNPGDIIDLGKNLVGDLKCCGRLLGYSDNNSSIVLLEDLRIIECCV